MPPKQTKTPAESVLEMGKEVTKEAIRKSVWNYLEDNDLVQFPRPVFNRIPNFIGAAAAAEKVTTMEEFKRAQTVKINPDKPQENARFLTMEANKTLLVPTPRLRHGLFNKLLPPPGCSKEILRYCSTSQGLKEYSVPIGLEAKVVVDLVVIGSVAVSKEGFRIGKGEGFADLEYAMMVSMGAVCENTIVVTTVHDTQIMDIPESLIEEHDLLVDYIVTETQVIKCNRTRPKPKGIIWNKLTPEKVVRQVPILKHLRELEKEAGKDVTLKDGREEEDIPAREERGNRDDDRPGYRYRYRRNRRYGGRFRGGRGGPRRRQDTNESGEVQENGDVSEGGAGDEDKPKPRMRRNRRFRRRGGPPRRRDDGDHNEESHEEDGHTNEEDDEGDRRPPRRRNFRRRRPRTRQESENTGDEEGMSRPPRRRRNPRMRPPIPTIFVGSIQRSVRVSELKSEIRGKDVNPIRVIWNGAKGYSLLQFQEMQEMESALDALANLEIRGRKLRVEVSNRLKQGDGDHDSDVDGPHHDYDDNQQDD